MHRLKLRFVDIELFQHGLESADFEFIFWVADNGDTIPASQLYMTALAMFLVQIKEQVSGFRQFLTRLMNSWPFMAFTDFNQ